MVEVDNVSKSYGALEAVCGATFRADKGEILGLLGPNGAGKTTLMRIITGYLPATSGTVRVGGRDIFDDAMQVKKNLGYLPENPPLYQDMTVFEYLWFVAELKGVPRASRKSAVEKAVAAAALGDVSGRLIENISKGYRQRTGIAQAMVNEPDVLVLDEPTVGLDPKQIIEIRELIKSLGRDRTVILSSHILPEVSVTCDRIVILNKGKIAAIDSKDNLLAKLEGGGATLDVELEAPADAALAALEKIPGVASARPDDSATGQCAFVIEPSPGADVRAAVFDCAVAHGWKLLGMSRRTASLEDVFLDLTRTESAEGGDDDE